MRNTLIPLDIVYIHPDDRLLSIGCDVSPFDRTLVPAGGVMRDVLEMRAGLPGGRIVHRSFPHE